MKSSSRSVINSLKGRIWLAAGTLAVADCLLGLGAYLVLTFLSADPFLTLFATIVLLTGASLGFGWLLARDLLKPVEEVALLARSLERSPSASLPRTTGAIETDQLLQTLHKNGQQLRNLISVMDDVAAGKTEAATIPLETSDKLSSSFQKLVAKVTDSISAKNDLDELRAAVAQLSSDVSKVRGGQLDLHLKTDQPQTKEIADVLRFLTTKLAGLTQQIYATTSECERAAADARSCIKSSLDAIDQRGVTSAARELGHENSKLEALLTELSVAVKGSSDLYDGYVADNAGSSRIADASQQLKSGVIETGRLVQKLRNRTSVVSQLGRQAQDISKRSNLIALNVSIASNGLTSSDVLVSEIENLSTRSEELHRQILFAGESFNSEIAGIEKEIASLSEFAPDISRSLNASVQVSHSLCEQIARIGELEQQIRAASEAESLENDRLKGIIEKFSDVSVASSMLRESESSIQRFPVLLEALRDSVSDLKISTSSQRRPAPAMPVSIQEPATPSIEPRDASPKASFDTFVATTAPEFRPEPAIPAAAQTQPLTPPSAASTTGFETLIDMTAHFGEN
ncbi:MAG: methyl-accepting chemotaxis protein [Pyrinomonadaceae bacterium]